MDKLNLILSVHELAGAGEMKKDTVSHSATLCSFHQSGPSAMHKVTAHAKMAKFSLHLLKMEIRSYLLLSEKILSLRNTCDLKIQNRLYHRLG